MPSSLAVSFAGYKRSWLMADVLAGLTLVAIAVPEQIATAKLASMPAVTGLWAFVVGSLMIAVLGRSAHVSVGADSTIAPVLAAGVASVAASGARATELTSFVAVAVGVVVIGAGLLKFGWIADFLSAPVIAGLLAGIGVEIVVRQLPVVLGVPAEGTTTVDQLRHVVANIGSANGWTIVLAALVLVIIFGAERADTGRLVGVVADPGAANQPHALMTSSVVTPPTTSKSVWPMRHRPLRRSRSTQTTPVGVVDGSAGAGQRSPLRVGEPHGGGAPRGRSRGGGADQRPSCPAAVRVALHRRLPPAAHLPSPDGSCAQTDGGDAFGLI